MPKRTDIKKILLIGSGPIIISQACEFDYSGTQACKALREDGYEIVLLNSNPATIMTDPEMAQYTYVEPITPETVAKIIRRERPDALLPTLGGQTALNVAVKVAEMGILEEFGVEMIGANASVTKPVFVYGAGLDWGLVPHLGLRFQYRGNLYKAPDLTTVYTSTGAFMHSSEPTLGVYFRF